MSSPWPPCSPAADFPTGTEEAEIEGILCPSDLEARSLPETHLQPVLDREAGRPLSDPRGTCAFREMAVWVGRLLPRSGVHRRLRGRECACSLHWESLEPEASQAVLTCAHQLSHPSHTRHDAWSKPHCSCHADPCEGGWPRAGAQGGKAANSVPWASQRGPMWAGVCVWVSRLPDLPSHL